MGTSKFRMSGADVDMLAEEFKAPSGQQVVAAEVMDRPGSEDSSSESGQLPSEIKNMLLKSLLQFGSSKARESVPMKQALEDARIPELGIGGAQGVLSGATSIANIAPDLVNAFGGNMERVPSVDLTQYGKQDPLSRAAMTTGEFAGLLGTGGALTKGMSSLFGSPKTLLDIAGRGAAAGAALSGDGARPGYEIPQRMLGGALGGALEGGTSLLSKNIGSKISDMRNRVLDKYTSQYNNFFSDLESGNIGQNLKVPTPVQKKTNEMYSSLSAETKRAAKAFEKKPTFKKAHNFASEIKKDIRNFLSKEKSTSAQNAEDMLNRLYGSMYQGIKDNPEYLSRYKELTKGYAQEAVPFKTDLFKKHEAGKLSDSKLALDLFKQRSKLPPSLTNVLLEDFLPQIPGFEARSAMMPHHDKILKALLYGGAAGATGAGISGISRMLGDAGKIVE